MISRMVRPSRWVSVFSTVAVLALAACGKDDPVSPQVAKSDLTAPASQQTIALLAATTVTLPGAGAAFGAASAGQNVTMVFDAAGLTPVISIGGNDEIEAGLTFGSCIFTIRSVRRGTTFRVGQVITVPVCNLVIRTGGQPVGTAFTTTFVFVFGGFTSSPLPGTFTVTTGGSVSGGRQGGPTITIGTVPTGSGS